MGIPSLFRTLVGTYPGILTSKIRDDVDHLYLDYNCLIHHCKNTFVSSSTTPRSVEEEFITHVINYTQHIICDVVQPRKLVYIAVDGPVPMTKLLKQRARRYKKIQDRGYKQKMCENHGYVSNKNEFDGNKITPGTTFMFKLCSRLKNFVMLGAFGKHLQKKNKQFSVFVSDANIAGEGEQKIFDFIKNNKGIPKIVIYGLDADLIILTMQCSKQNVHLLRETQNLNVEEFNNEPFVFFNIDRCTEYLLKDYNLTMHSRSQIIDDIVLLSFFGGNDFVDHFVHTKIKDNGFDRLLTAYKKVLCQTTEYLTTGDSINYEFLCKILEFVQEFEDLSVKQNLVHNSSKPICFGKKATPKEKIDVEMQKYEHCYYTDAQNPFNQYYASVMNQIDYSENYETWKSQYNSHFFQNTEMDSVCYEYLKCVYWNWLYYKNHSPPSWSYYYPYRHSPLSSTLYNYISKKSCKFDFKFVQDKPYVPFLQLLIVLPIQNNNLHPFAISKVLQHLNNEHPTMFVKKFKLDAAKGFKNIYSEPLLDHPDIDFFESIICQVPVSEPEYVRNVIRTKPFTFKY